MANPPQQLKSPTSTVPKAFISPASTASSFPAQVKGLGLASLPSEVHSMVNRNPAKLQFLGTIAGGLLILVGVLCSLNIFSALTNPVKYILNFFFIVFGSCTLVTSWFPESGASRSVYSQCSFLSNALGRGFFYVFQGCLLTALGVSGGISWLYLLVGVLLLLLGLLSLLVAWRSPASR